MTESEAREMILVGTAAVEIEPQLTSADIDLLVRRAKRVDEFGVLPADTSWTPTWDLNFSIAQGWLIRTGRLVDCYTFMVHGKMFSRQQIFNHCMEMYKRYNSKGPIKAMRLGAEVNEVDLVNSVGNNA